MDVLDGFKKLFGRDPSPTEVRRDYDGHEVWLDLDKQVLALDVLDVPSGGETLHPTLARVREARGSGGMLSASVLFQKAKVFDDGLYAAVERAAQRGAGAFAGKSDLLARLAAALGGGTAHTAVQTIFAAARLGGTDTPAIAGAGADGVAAQLAEFEADELQSKPLGFYTWNDELRAIYRQDRMLQRELTGKAGIELLVRTLHADEKARTTYLDYVALVTRLTNPFPPEKPSLKGLLLALEDGGLAAPGDGVWVLPPSRSPEADLVKKLFGANPVPPEFDLVVEVTRRVRSGELDLTPAERSGWYDRQIWSLAPLLAPDRMAEKQRLAFGEGYRELLDGLVRSLLALTRETHVKQLEVPIALSAPPADEDDDDVITITPVLSAEPFATSYRRRAEAYAFVRQGLVRLFGDETLGDIHRLIEGGEESPRPLAQELEEIETLFHGAAAAVERDLGIVTEDEPRDADEDRLAFETWCETMDDDVDLARDVRAMVPLFHDATTNLTKVLVVLGWSARPVTVAFVHPPKVRSKERCEFETVTEIVPYPVAQEIWVPRLRDRDELRAVCDEQATADAIVAALTDPNPS